MSLNDERGEDYTLKWKHTLNLALFRLDIEHFPACRQRSEQLLMRTLKDIDKTSKDKLSFKRRYAGVKVGRNDQERCSGGFN